MAIDLTLEQALEQVNMMPLPEVAEGDIIWYPGKVDDSGDLGYRFIYQSGTWVHHP
jgi:hypothetical protein